MQQHADNWDQRSLTVGSLTSRLPGQAESERVMSASPAGDWLDSLRESFEPGSKSKAESDATPGLIARLRSA